MGHQAPPLLAARVVVGERTVSRSGTIMATSGRLTIRFRVDTRPMRWQLRLMRLGLWGVERGRFKRAVSRVALWASRWLA